ncbi:hypothetical protein ACX1C1_16790 [Paenibacillus sp. strain BS8-2]
MTTFHNRQLDIVKLIAERACSLPLLSSGLWFHGDIRDNLYHASYLYAAAIDGAPLPLDHKSAIETATSVLLQVLDLQDHNPESATYGHWPLHLGDKPADAPKHILPVEIMSCLLSVFRTSYGEEMKLELRQALDTSIDHMYHSRYYDAPLHMYNHHEAKHTAAALIFGTIRDDAALLQTAAERVRSTLTQLETHGMSEYGILPWFWHWTQSYSAAWQLVQDDAVKEDIERLLKWLWQERADYYFHGAWAGPHSRSLPSDAPTDRCAAFDYVQFGDFELPMSVHRPEYAGLLLYEIPEYIRQSALNRSYPLEIKRHYPASAIETGTRRRSVVLLDETFALGGMLDRVVEFDNEQHRWDITFPIAQGAVNQAYFAHPAASGDKLRHSSGAEDIAIEGNCLIALYQPTSDADHDRPIVGILPPGEWIVDERAIYGQVGAALLAFHLMKPIALIARTGDTSGFDVEALEGGSNGVIVEAISQRHAATLGIHSLADFVANRGANAPKFVAEPLSASYIGLSGATINLTHSRG